MSAAVTRRTALQGSLAASLGLAAGAAPAIATPNPDAVLITAVGTLKELYAREQQAWNDLDDHAADDDPASLEASSLAAAVLAAGETLADIPALTPAGLAAKASAMLALIGRGRWAAQEALSEHHQLAASVLRDAVRLGGAHA